MVELQLPKLRAGVRFPSPAPPFAFLRNDGPYKAPQPNRNLDLEPVEGQEVAATSRWPDTLSDCDQLKGWLPNRKTLNPPRAGREGSRPLVRRGPHLDTCHDRIPTVRMARLLHTRKGGSLDQGAKGRRVGVAHRHSQSRRTHRAAVLGDVDLGSDRVEVRVGYVIAEEFWGRGFASELVGGLVRWCQDRTDVASIVGGVANKHPASARVLSKNGFVADSMTENETLYRLRITG